MNGKCTNPLSSLGTTEDLDPTNSRFDVLSIALELEPNANHIRPVHIGYEDDVAALEALPRADPYNWPDRSARMLRGHSVVCIQPRKPLASRQGHATRCTE